MPYFNIVAQTSENTVVTEYEPVTKRSDSYQSEAALEREFIRMLTEQGYEHLSIHSEKDLIANLRSKLEELNDYHFSEDEWSRFFAEAIAYHNGNNHKTNDEIRTNVPDPGETEGQRQREDKYPLYDVETSRWPEHEADRA